MIDRGKASVLGVLVDAVDDEAAVERIVRAALARRPLAATALAVHGVMTGVLDSEQRFRLNRLDLVAPDGQPVRWALNRLHRAALPERVYGPTLTLHVCERAAALGLPVLFYGSRPEVVAALAENLRGRFPSLKVAGAMPSRFRRLDPEEQRSLAAAIRATGAAIVFAGLGCPRQEAWAFEMAPLLGVPVVAVGAAFDFHAGTLPQAPAWYQRHGLEWLYRFASEPARLWRRYLLLNPYYLWLLALQATGLRSFDPDDARPPRDALRHG